jgi:gliding motility-associated-like protein
MKCFTPIGNDQRSGAPVKKLSFSLLLALLLLMPGIMAVAQKAEIEPNDACSTATIIDKGYGDYTGQIAVNPDYWLIPITVPQGTIHVEFTSSSPGGNGDGLAGLEYALVDSRLGAVDACGPSQGVVVAADVTFDPTPIVFDISWTNNAQSIIYVRIKVYDIQSLGFEINYTMKLSGSDQVLDGRIPSIQVYPADVKGTNLWLDAKQGITKNGNTLTGWKDQMGINNFTLRGNLTVEDKGLNFNPVIQFSNPSTATTIPVNRLDGNTAITATEFFSVMKQESTDGVNYGTLLGGLTPGNTTGVGIFGGILTNTQVTDGNGGFQFMQNPLKTSYSIVNLDVSKTTAPFAEGSVNGEVQSFTNNGNDFSSITFTPMVGGSNNGSVTQSIKDFDGRVAEIITYPTKLSTQDRLKVLSYLALKYGITLDPAVGQYVTSDNIAIWNNTTYWHDVFGIGKNSTSALDQPKSYSLNTAQPDGTGQPGKGHLTITGTPADKTYLMVGHNNGGLSFSDRSNARFALLNRKWKVKNTGNVGRVDLTFDLEGLPVAQARKDQLALLIDLDGDGNFTTGNQVEVQAASYKDNIISFPHVSLPDNAVFTFGETVETVAPVFPNRIIENPGFEENNVSNNGQFYRPGSSGAAGSLAQIKGWYSTHPDFVSGGKLLIEPIALSNRVQSGGGGPSAKEGLWFGTTAVSEKSYIYQNVYLVNGETMDWSYYHRLEMFRGGVPDVVEMNLYSLAGAKVLQIDRSSTTDENNWVLRRGSTTISIPTGVYRLGFEYISGAAVQGANWLDAINIVLKALVEFNSDTVRIRENSTSAPYFLVNGVVQQASSFTINVTNGTAIEGTDFRVSNKTRSIPVGNYALKDSLQLGLTIVNNDIPENDRYFTLSIANSTGDVDRRDANADGVYQQTLVVVIEDDDPCKNPGTSNTYSVCAANATSVDLLAQLGGKPDAGGTWTDLDATGVNLTNPAAVNLSGLALGSYRFNYSFASIGICPVEEAILTIVIREPFPAGEDAAISICQNSTVNLLTSLGGAPKPGGAWTEHTTSGVNLTDPTSVNFTGVAVGTYEFAYTLSGEVECDGTTAIALLTVNIVGALNAGTDNTVNECSNIPLNLFTSLGGTPSAGGTWTETSTVSSGANITNPSSVDFSAVAAGSYIFTYTLAGNASCPAAVSNVTVNVDVPHDAGTNNTVFVCNDVGTVNLFTSLGGTPDPGGSWADTDASGVSLTNPTAVSFAGKAAGDYRFTYTIIGTGSCTTQSAIVTVTVRQAVNAGKKTTINVCTGGPTVIDLFTSLKGSPDAGGTWTEISTISSNVNLSNPASVDFTNTAAGAYEFKYVVNATAPCGNEEATLTVKVNRELNAGSNTRISLCNADGSAIDLFSKLAGNPDAGGTWTETSATNSGVNISNPASVNFNGVAPGDYEFTYALAGAGSCPGKSSILYVKVQRAYNPGISGTTSVCNSDVTPVNLFSKLEGTPDVGGTWKSVGHNLTTVGDLAVFTGVAPRLYIFMYQFADSLKVCPAESKVVKVTVDPQPVAGTDGHISICNGGSGTTRSLVAALGGTPDAGGTWTDEDGSGVNLTNPASVDFAAVAAGTYRYKYTVSGTGSCSDASATVTVVVNQTPNAGTNTTKTICNVSTSTINLLAQLNGSPATGGAWSFTSSNTFPITDPAQADISSANGTYVLTYTIVGEGTCPTASSTLTLTVDVPLYAGKRNVKIDVCNASSVPVDIENLFGAKDSGGIFADVDNSGVNLSNPKAVNFAGVAPGTYRFSYTVTNSCVTDVATNTVVVKSVGNAGNDASVKICTSETSYNLFAQLGASANTGGFWSDDNNTGVVVGNGTAVDFSTVKSGTYTYTYHVVNSTCTEDLAVVTVEVEDVPYAGVDNTVAICDQGSKVVNFNSALSLISSTQSEWKDDNASGVSLANLSSVNFSGVASGRYTFTHTVTSPRCGTAVNVLTVIINGTPNAGTSGGFGLCSGQTADLTEPLGIYDQGGVWRDDDGAGVNLFDPKNVDFTGVKAGVYEFTYTLTSSGGCSATGSSVVTISVDKLADQGESNTITVCDGATVDLFQSLNGSPDPGGIWDELTNSGVNISNPASVSFAGVPTGTYEFAYTQSSAGCGQVSSGVVVNVGKVSFAGNNASLALCNSASGVNLMQAIGNPQPGGVWTDKDGLGIDLSDPKKVTFAGAQAGNYKLTYSLSGGNACRSSEAVLVIAVSPGTNAGLSAAISLCTSSATAIDFMTSLGGTPDAGGTWVDVNNSGVSLANPKSVNLSTLASGTYRYNYLVNAQGSCSGSASTLTFTILKQPDAGIPINATVEACNSPNTLVDLTSNLTPGFSTGGTWKFDGVAVSNPQSFNLGGIEAGDFHQVDYSITATGTCVASSAIYSYNVLQGPNAGLPGSLETCQDQPTISLFDGISGSYDAGGTWTDLDNSGVDISDPTAVSFVNAKEGAYRFQYEVLNNGNCSGDAVNVVTVNVCAADFDSLSPAEGFSPNGDGINDYWWIKNIEAFPNNTVSIYNSMGSLVYLASGYNNHDIRFEGMANQNTVGGSSLNPGTYYYVISVEGQEKIKGYFTLLK